MADDEDKTYTFDELSPEAQEKACDNNRYWNVEDNSWLEMDYYETWLNELCAKRGVSFDTDGSMSIRAEYNRWWVEIENEYLGLARVSVDGDGLFRLSGSRRRRGLSARR